VVLFRNYLEPNVCPVVTLLTWLGVAGITSGPIFPALNNSHTNVIIGAYQSEKTFQARMRRETALAPAPRHAERCCATQRDCGHACTTLKGAAPR
jgi:hypothetical protein